MDTLLNDIRYGVRMLWKNKGLSAIAMLSLAVGIGGNAAVFSVVNSVLYRPRALPRPGELVAIYNGDRQQPYQSMSYPTYLDLREKSGVFAGLAAYAIAKEFTLAGGEDVEHVWGEVVSGNYFEVLGAQLIQGRGFLPEEDSVPGRNPVVVIGAGLWQRRFAGDPNLVGKTITLNRQPMTVVGIVSPRFTGMMAGWAAEVWVPAMMIPLLEPSGGMDMLTSRGSQWVALVGRLKQGVSIEQARTRVDVLVAGIKAEHPDEWKGSESDPSRERSLTVLAERDTRIHPAMRAPAYAVAALLFAIVDLVLIIACINLASMLFAKAVTRRGEMAVRLAIGARRGRIVRQLLTESVLLSLIAGVAGTTLALWGLKALTAAMPALAAGVRIALDIQVDWKVLLYSLAFATITGILFGLAPALHASRASLSSVLKDDSTTTARYRRSKIRQTLLVAQVAFSLLLLLGAGLVLRSLEKVRPTRLGFANNRVLVAPIVLDETRNDRRSSHQFFTLLSDRVAGLPGVQAVSLIDAMPGGFLSRVRRGIEIEGYAAARGEDMEIDAAVVGPRYFTHLQVPLVSGRDFTVEDRDGSPCVAIVNEAFTQRYLGGRGAGLGRNLIRRSGPKGPDQHCAIVGIVRDDAWQSLNATVRPFFALPLLQSDQRSMTLLVHTAVDPQGLVSGVRQTIRQLDPTMPLSEVSPLAEHFRTASYPFRLLGVAMAGAGVLALLLALVGIYGTISYSVAQRRRELGIRIAMGALKRDILGLVVGQGMRPVGIGLGLGLLLGFAFTRLLKALPLGMELLFGVSATDSLTFGGVTLLLGLVAIAACYVPAVRATRVNPTAILKDL